MNTTKPQLGQEYPAPNEAEDIQAIIDAIIKRLSREYKPGETLRQFHAKMHGCVKATFRVIDELPSNFQYGFLVPGKKYEAIIRFSNGNSKVLDDRKRDLRGMAIKLLNVPGEMIIEDVQQPHSQDLLLVSYPTLMSPDVKGFRKNILALCNGLAGMIKFALDPRNWSTVVRTLRSMQKCDSVLSVQYWSVSPSRLGSAEQAVKYVAIPIEKKADVVEKDNNFLRKEMQSRLQQDAIMFDFMVQLQTDPVSEPIENPCIEWKSPLVKVAEIKILPQNFSTSQQDAFGELLSFSPWHCLPEHTPLGGISRARKAAYAAISNFRLSRNQNKS